MNKTKKTKQKYNYGGYVKAGTGMLQGFMNIDNGDQDSMWQDIMLKQSRQMQNPSRIPNPNEALARNDISKAKAQYDANTPLTQILDIAGNTAMSVGTTMMGSEGASTTQPNGEAASTEGFGGFMNKLFAGQKKAYGGQVNSGGVPVEVEGQEVGQTPDGQMLNFQGPSHEQGGIDISLPEGTEIYSKRVKGPDGKSMADRKKARETQIANLEKLISKNPTDRNLKRTLAKTLKNFEMQEQQDMQKMQMAQQVQELEGMVQEFMNGGTVGREKYSGGGPVKIPYYLQNPDNDVHPQEFINKDLVDSILSNRGILDNASRFGDNTTDQNQSFETFSDQMNERYTAPSTTTEDTTTGKKKLQEKRDSTGTGLSVGDMIGMAGQAYSTFEPMKNTLRNRAGDTPNVNMFENYGKDGLQTVDDMKQYVNQIRDTQLQDLNLNRHTASTRNRNSARGVNTMRALDLATDAGVNNSQNQIYAQFAQAMQGILGQQAGMQNQKDQVVMGGEQSRDLADRQDRDNFYSQMARDISGKGYGLQNIGKSMNDVKTRNVTGRAINNMSDNFNVNINTGNVTKIMDAGDVQSADYRFLTSLPKDKMKLITDGKAEVRNGVLYEKGTDKKIKMD